MNKPLFTGVCTALVTPFYNGKINYPLLQILLQRQIAAGVKAVVISGTTGEAPTLSDEEKIQLIDRCKEFIGGRMLLIAGTGSNSTEHAVALSRCAAMHGADALLVVSPYYNKANAEGIYAHYHAICSAVNVPVIVYNVPSRTGLDIPLSVYQRLSQIENIAGIKEASNSIQKILKTRFYCPDLPVWSGNDEMITPVISLGGCGVISVLSNVLPEETVLLTEAALDGDFDTAAALQCRLLTLIEALFSDVNPIPVKEAMRLIGFDCGSCRMPLGKLGQENVHKLEALLQK